MELTDLLINKPYRRSMVIRAVKSDRHYSGVTGATLFSVLQCRLCCTSYYLLIDGNTETETGRSTEQEPRQILNTLQVAIDIGHVTGHMEPVLLCDQSCKAIGAEQQYC